MALRCESCRSTDAVLERPHLESSESCASSTLTSDASTRSRSAVRLLHAPDADNRLGAAFMHADKCGFAERRILASSSSAIMRGEDKRGGIFPAAIQHCSERLESGSNKQRRRDSSIVMRTDRSQPRRARRNRGKLLSSAMASSHPIPLAVDRPGSVS